MSVMVHSVHNNIVLHIGTPCCLFSYDFQPWLTMLFPVWLSHVSRACTALSKHGVGVEPPFWPDFWDRGRACARGGGYGGQPGAEKLESRREPFFHQPFVVLKKETLDLEHDVPSHSM